MKTPFIRFTSVLIVPTFAMLCALALISPARADDSKLSSKDKSFITNAAEAGNAEIEKAKIADKTSSSPEVKDFAAMMIKDHTKAGDELASIASGKGKEPTKSPGAEQDADILMLKAKSGESFDKAYAKQAVADHKQAVALFEKASTDLDDPDLKAFAEKTLPTLKHHLEAAEKLEAQFSK